MADSDISSNSVVVAAESIFGDPHTFSPADLDRIAEDAVIDRQIAALAKARVSYPEIADRLDMSLPDLLRRISTLLSTRDDILSSAMLDQYLEHQLKVTGEVIANAMADMETIAGGDISESVASKSRHNGRLAALKALQHEALVLGMVRQRLDILQATKVEISVVTREQWDAL